MANSLYIMEAANLVCGDGGDSGGAAGESTHIELQELKLPGLEQGYVDHNPGGGAFAIEVPTNFNKLEATFNLAGWNPAVMGMLGRSERENQVFTAYGLIRDRMTGQALQSIAVMQGNLGRTNPTAFRRGDLHAHEYAIKGIVHYELYMQEAAGAGPTEIYYWDFFTSTRRVGGIDTFAEYNRILATGQASVSAAG